MAMFRLVVWACMFLFASLTPLAAEKWEQDCKAVATLATISYDSKLIVGTYEMIDKQICFFSVSLPDVAGDASIPKVAEMIMKVRKDPVNLPAIYAQDSASMIIEALVSPAMEKRLSSPEGDKAIETIKQRTAAIDQCIQKNLVSDAAFGEIDDVVSCGFSADGSTFKITAVAEGVAFSLIVPVA